MSEESDREHFFSDRPTFPVLKARLEELQQLNKTALQALTASGVAVDLATVMHVRLAQLVETLLGSVDTQFARVEYEIRVQENLAEVITQVNSEVARARLLQGVNLRPDPNHN